MKTEELEGQKTVEGIHHAFKFKFHGWTYSEIREIKLKDSGVSVDAIRFSAASPLSPAHRRMLLPLTEKGSQDIIHHLYANDLPFALISLAYERDDATSCLLLLPPSSCRTIEAVGVCGCACVWVCMVVCAWVCVCVCVPVGVGMGVCVCVQAPRR